MTGREREVLPATWEDHPGITFRQDCLFYRSLLISVGVLLAGLLALVIATWQTWRKMEYGWLFPLCVPGTALPLLGDWLSRKSMVTINETGISCRLGTEPLWAYKWEQIRELRKCTRLRSPAVEIVPASEAAVRGPVGERKGWFELGRAARQGLKQYSPGPDLVRK